MMIPQIPSLVSAPRATGPDPQRSPGGDAEGQAFRSVLDQPQKAEDDLSHDAAGPFAEPAASVDSNAETRDPAALPEEAIPADIAPSQAGLTPLAVGPPTAPGRLPIDPDAPPPDIRASVRLPMPAAIWAGAWTAALTGRPDLSEPDAGLKGEGQVLPEEPRVAADLRPTPPARTAETSVILRSDGMSAAVSPSMPLDPPETGVGIGAPMPRANADERLVQVHAVAILNLGIAAELPVVRDGTAPAPPSLATVLHLQGRSAAPDKIATPQAPRAAEAAVQMRAADHALTTAPPPPPPTETDTETPTGRSKPITAAIVDAVLLPMARPPESAFVAAPAASPLSAPSLPSVALPPATAPALVVAVSQSSGGVVELVLTPEDLGRLKFEVTQTGDVMRVHLTVERPETLDLLRRNADQLLAEFRQAGYSGATLSFAQGGQGGQGDRHPESPQPAMDPAGPDPSLSTPPTDPTPALQTALGGLDLRL